MSNFGNQIRQFREDKGMPIRKLAALLDIDASTLSKIERGERNAQEDHIQILSEIFQIDYSTLIASYFSDKIAEHLINTENYQEVLKLAEEKIRYLRSNNVDQQKLKF